MRRHFTLLILTSFFLTSGCWSNDITNDPSLIIKDEQLVTVLFSDEDFLHEEGNYYDALLDLKKNYPEIVNTIHIILSNEQDLVRYFDISEYPTLLIINEDIVKTRIEGSQATTEIIYEIEKALQKERPIQ